MAEGREMRKTYSIKWVEKTGRGVGRIKSGALKRGFETVWDKIGLRMHAIDYGIHGPLSFSQIQRAEKRGLRTENVDQKAITAAVEAASDHMPLVMLGALLNFPGTIIAIITAPD